MAPGVGGGARGWRRAAGLGRARLMQERGGWAHSIASFGARLRGLQPCCLAAQIFFSGSTMCSFSPTLCRPFSRLSLASCAIWFRPNRGNASAALTRKLMRFCCELREHRRCRWYREGLATNADSRASAAERGGAARSVRGGQGRPREKPRARNSSGDAPPSRAPWWSASWSRRRPWPRAPWRWPAQPTATARRAIQEDESSATEEEQSARRRTVSAARVASTFILSAVDDIVEILVA